jgi:membrane protein
MEGHGEPWRWLRRLLLFAGRVLRSFARNRGILLAGGVGYNALLSLVPFLTLTVAALSIFFDEAHRSFWVSALLSVACSASAPSTRP